MESIKETELNLQREVVTTVPNTWLVEAVNPSTGEKKMINIANYTSVVAGRIGTSVDNKTSNSLMPAGSYGYYNNVKSVRLFTTVSQQCSLGCIVMYCPTTGGAQPSIVLITVGKSAENTTLSVRCKYLIKGSTTMPIQYKTNSDKSVSVYIKRTQFTPVYSAIMLGLAYKEGLMTSVESTELDDAVDATVIE